MTDFPLEPTGDRLRAMGLAVLDQLADFVDGLPDAPAHGLGSTGTPPQELLAPPPEGPGELGPLLATFRRAAADALECAGPGYLAYIPGGGQLTAAFGELLALAANRFTSLAGAAPALVAMEHSVIRWLADLFGLPGGATGLVTTGGSMATLSALVTARNARLGEDFLDGTVYVTEHTHHCVAKAVRIAGLPASRIRVVPTDAALRMDPRAAADLVAADRAAGLRPFLLVGTAGTTNAGAVDPLAELAEVAAGAGLWFHVDAAYGGFFQLTERGRAAFAGIAAADSVVLDPHKGMFLPYGTGVLLVRDAEAIRLAHSGGADYLQDMPHPAGLPDYAQLGPELSREYRGLRLWLPLHLHGVAAFREQLDEKLDLAWSAYRALAADPAIEVPVEPELSIVTFRLAGRSDEANQRFLEAVNARRRIFLSSTRIGGRFTLRLCVLSLRTHADRMAEAVELIQQEMVKQIS